MPRANGGKSVYRVSGFFLPRSSKTADFPVGFFAFSYGQNSYTAQEGLRTNRTPHTANHYLL